MISASGEETIADWLLARDPAWVPVLVGPPAADHAIRWMAASPTTFDDPFFAQSVERLQWTFSQMGMLDTSPSVLCSVAARLPEVEPAAIVFHISRCGSTLLVNALKRCQQVLGLSEPQPFNRITGLCASKSSYWRGESVGLARGLTSVYASISRAHPLRVVYKVSPAAVIALPYLRSIWPSVPFILLVRDPVEVVVSNLLKPPKWISERRTSPIPAAFGSPPSAVSARGPASFCAWFVGKCCEHMANMPTQGCYFMDYEGLSPSAMLRLIAQLNLTLPTSANQGFAEAVSTYSKDFSVSFKDDRESKRALVTEKIQTAVEEFAAGPYKTLKRKWTAQFLGAPQACAGRLGAHDDPGLGS